MRATEIKCTFRRLEMRATDQKWHFETQESPTQYKVGLSEMSNSIVGVYLVAMLRLNTNTERAGR